MKHQIALRAAAALALSLGFAGVAHAAGTPAGTKIANTATATYTTGGTTGTIQSNTVNVTVDELVNVTVTPLITTPVVASGGPATLVYQVTNNGNGSEPFNLTANPAVAGNAFNGTVNTIAIDTNNDGIYEAGTDTLVTNGSASPVLAPDASVHVLVLVTPPGTATDGQTSQTQLTAAWPTGTGTPGKVFTGKGNGGVDAVIGATGGQGSALETLVDSTTTVTLNKTATIADPFGGTSPVPGAVVTYAITSHVVGSGTATALTVADAYPAGTTYQAGTMTLNGTALTDAADADAGTASGTGISVVLGNVKGGTPDQTVTFKVKIN